MKNGMSVTSLLLCLTLTACGGGGSSGTSAQSAPAPAVNTSMTTRYLAACQVNLTGSSTQAWTTSERYVSGNPAYNVSAMVSPGGSSTADGQNIVMNVPSTEVPSSSTAIWLPSGVRTPENVMGVRLAATFGAQAVACVANVSRAEAPKSSGAGYKVNWQSEHIAILPVDFIQGTPIDGFELIANFSPREARAYFVKPKSLFGSVSRLSICFLPTTGGSWDCTTPTIDETATAWTLVRQNAREGIYMLIFK